MSYGYKESAINNVIVLKRGSSILWRQNNETLLLKVWQREGVRNITSFMTFCDPNVVWQNVCIAYCTQLQSKVIYQNTLCIKKNISWNNIFLFEVICLFQIFEIEKKKLRIENTLSWKMLMSRMAWSTSIIVVSLSVSSIFSHGSAVNFINIIRANFSYKRRFSSFYYVHVTRKKLLKWRSYKKCAHIKLMKLTPGCS